MAGRQNRLSAKYRFCRMKRKFRHFSKFVVGFAIPRKIPIFQTITGKNTEIRPDLAPKIVKFDQNVPEFDQINGPTGEKP